MYLRASKEGRDPELDAARPPGDERLGTNTAGLSSIEAARLLKTVGPNEPAHARRLSALRQLLSSFANPLLGILFVAAVASAVLGETVNAAIVLAMVVLSG